MMFPQKTTPDCSPQSQNAVTAVNPIQAFDPGGGNQTPTQDPKIGLPGDVNAPVPQPESGSD